VTASAPRSQTVRSADGTAIAYRRLGDGPAVIVVGGALRCADDYLALAEALARRGLTAVVIDRRGRGASGPQGDAYTVGDEVQDVLAVARAESSSVLFGHSYGGLIALEAARGSDRFATVVAYEPGVSIGNSIATDWLGAYRDRLAAGDRRGAFAAMVTGGGHSPLSRLPGWYARLILRAVIRRRRWKRLEPLLETNLAEHEQLAVLDDGSADRYRAVSAQVLLLGGSKSPPSLTSDLFAALQATIPNCSGEVIDGLDHFGPDEGAPELIAERIHGAISPTGP